MPIKFRTLQEALANFRREDAEAEIEVAE